MLTANLDIQRKERQESKEAGNLVPREQFEVELAALRARLDPVLRCYAVYMEV